MKLVKIFNNGRSQVVRLPKDYRFEDDEVFVNKIGDIVILMPKKKKWKNLEKALDMFSDDYFIEDRKQGEVENRVIL